MSNLVTKPKLIRRGENEASVVEKTNYNVLDLWKRMTQAETEVRNLKKNSVSIALFNRYGESGPYRLVYADYAVSAQDFFIDVEDAVDITITLPPFASARPSKDYQVRKRRVPGTTITVDGNGALINGEPVQLLLAQYDAPLFKKGATEWEVR